MNAFSTLTFSARRTARISALAATFFLTLGVATVRETGAAQDAVSAKPAAVAQVADFAKPAAPRTWTFKDDDRVSALLLKVFSDRASGDAESVALRSVDDGSIIIAPLADLSAADRDFVEKYRPKEIYFDDELISRFDDSSSVDAAVEERKKFGTPEKFALLIGINEYPHFPKSAQLKYCAKDMALLADVLTKNGFPPENVFTLTSDGAAGTLPPTKENIEGQIDALSRFVDENDTIFIAFSGHGVAFAKNNYLCPSDTPKIEAEDFERKLVSRSWILERAKTARAKNRILLFDACRNNPFEAGKELGSGRRSVAFQQVDRIQSLSEEEQKGDFYVMVGCEYGKFSTEAEELENGLFTYYLAEGLRGYADQQEFFGNEDGKVNVKEAFEYASERTRKYKNSNGDVQRPLDHRSAMDYAPELTVVPDDLPPLLDSSPLSDSPPPGLRFATIFTLVGVGAFVAAAIVVMRRVRQILEPKLLTVPRLVDAEKRAKALANAPRRAPSRSNAQNFVANAKTKWRKISERVATKAAEKSLQAEIAAQKRAAEIANSLRLARSFFDARNYLGAETELRKVFALESNNAGAKSLQAEIAAEKRASEIADAFRRARDLLAAQNYEGAEAELRRIFDRDPDNADAKSLQTEIAAEKRASEIANAFRRARILFSAQNYAGAEAELQKIFELDENNADAAAFQEEIEKAREAVGQADAAKFRGASFGDGVQAGASETLTIKNVDCVFRWCPPGEFLMGSPAAESERADDETQHKVTLTQGFWLLETQVSQAMWRRTAGANPSEFEGPDRPVENVSWIDCLDFIARLQNSAPAGWRFALPTEAQWEYACRAGTTTPYHFGSVLNGERANCNGNYPYGTSTKGPFLGATSFARRYAPNAWGLRDMHGNVWEWCADWYGEYPRGEATDPAGSSGSFRVFRGGGWNSNARNCRSAFRDFNVPSFRSHHLGLRVALVRR